MNRPLAPTVLLVAIGVACSAFGCKDISRFSTDPGENYCGNIVPAPFVRQGFTPGVRMRMTFDSDHILTSPGALSTDEGSFKNAALRAIPPLFNDPLSSLSFGEGRERNLVYGVEPSDGPTAFAVVSLLDNGNVEVRILRGAPPAPGLNAVPANNGPVLFGVFPLTRQRGTCGF